MPGTTMNAEFNMTRGLVPAIKKLRVKWESGAIK